MYLMNEALARAHMDARRAEAMGETRAARLTRARRAQRRAAEARQRARRATAHLL